MSGQAKSLSGLDIQPGGDPRALPEYRMLRTEMARLTHPAWPDVDWRQVEQCCLDVFARNGADLQTAAAYALARSHRAGVNGMSEGVTVMENLLQAGSNTWPRGVSARAEIFGGLFGQLQAVLREMEINTGDLADLGLLNVQLGQLRQTLRYQSPLPTRPLEQLRQQIAQRASRIERVAQATAMVAQHPTQPSPLHTETHLPAQRGPAVTQPTPAQAIRPRTKKRLAVWTGVVIATLLSLIAALAWQ